MQSLDTINKARLTVEQDPSLSIYERIHHQFKIFQLILEETTDTENIAFTTLFSRLAFLTKKYKFEANTSFYTHTFRRTIEKGEIDKYQPEEVLSLGFWTIDTLLHLLQKTDGNAPVLEDSVTAAFAKEKIDSVAYSKIIEAVVVDFDTEAKMLTIIDEAEADTEKLVKYDVGETNENFTSNVEAATRVYPIPFHINLVDVNVTKDNVLIPFAFIINPDYLIDVTSVASYTKQKGTDSWLYAMAKFSQFQMSKPLLVGNVANYLLDALVQDSNIELSSLYHDIFRLYPLSWAGYDNQEVNEIIADIKVHYTNLKRVITEDLDRYNIEKKNIYLEPSFYCRNYGLQGRLDLFHVDNEGQQAEIIELKSGKVFKPNAYKINNAHYTQTLCYDLMIQSAYGNRLKPHNYILYSKVEKDNLRYAPTLKEQQYEAMRVRNDLTNIDHALAASEETVKSLLQHLQLANYSDLKGFLHTNLKHFEETYNSLSSLEKTYLRRYTRFVAREQILAKTGEHGLAKSNGLSALWLENLQEKQDRFSIFNYLQLRENLADGEDALLIFHKTEYSAELANFRIGDIAVLYPHQFNTKAVLQHQVFKCTIIEIGDTEIVVRLRNQQHNQQIFIDNEYWNIEEDTLDSGYRNMFRLLFEFAAADVEKRRLIMGHSRPKWTAQDKEIALDEHLTSEQKSIVRKILNTEDYFLLWGPPGTGKTSVMLKSLARILYDDTSENIMLLAYTNRAVDEICGALKDAGLEGNFIRIGSRYSVKEEYRSNLLNHRIKDFTKREQITQLIKKTRIYTGTLSSVISANELFGLKQFDTVIIDEASQILEPMLAGLLTRFSRFVLIGDHKQLPAIVKQSHHESLISDKTLQDEGFTDTRQSLFERLYFQCVRNNWDNGWALLSMQGRMHHRIMDFVSTHFYDQKLKIIPSLGRLTRHLEMKSSTPTEEQLCRHRMIYIDTAVDKDFNLKTNIHEANVVARLISTLQKLHKDNNIDITESTIGVITPYRAQIAMLKKLLGSNAPNITVDTVERYQGGARKIVILSLCTNQLSQLRSLVSLSTEGIDRKLNVAITRAKEQIVIIGNKSILQSNDTYKALIDACHHLTID